MLSSSCHLSSSLWRGQNPGSLQDISLTPAPTPTFRWKMGIFRVRLGRKNPPPTSYQEKVQA